MYMNLEQQNTFEQELTFEQAEAQLTPAQRSELAHCLLEKSPLPAKLSDAQRTFYSGLNVFCEYEDEAAVRSYLL